MARIFISAGEASGDLHGAALIKELKKRQPGMEFTFLGGDEMAAEVGHAPLIHMRDMAFMGFTEVLKNLGKIRRNLKTAKDAIKTEHPDAVVLIDYPGFNMKLARLARKLNVPVFYYIAPKVWAWKSWRVKSLKRDVTRILSILPFEPAWFKAHGAVAEYVGNPSVEELTRKLRPTERENILALVPGSRVAEIRSNLPVMVQVAKMHPELKPIVATAPGIDKELYTAITDFELSPQQAIELMQRSRAALVTSGTATLECALTRTPQVACYRSNGLKISHDIFKHVLKIRYVTLPNLIMDAPVIPEMLVHHCNPREVNAALTPLLTDATQRTAQLQGYEEIAARLATDISAPEAAANIILSSCE